MLVCGPIPPSLAPSRHWDGEGQSPGSGQVREGPRREGQGQQGHRAQAAPRQVEARRGCAHPTLAPWLLPKQTRTPQDIPRGWGRRFPTLRGGKLGCELGPPAQ